MAVREKDQSQPPITDPQWAKWSDPLYTYLSSAKQRTWPQLERWAKDHRMTGNRLRNCLAYLSIQSHAHSRILSDTEAVWLAGPAPLKLDNSE